MLNCIRLRVPAYAAVLLALVVMLPGCGGASGMASVLKVIGVSALVPDDWSSRGGLVRIIADVISGESLLKVVAKVISHSSPHPIEVILTRNAEGKYEGEIEITENPNETTPIVYTTIVEAQDVVGNTAESAPVSVEVPPAE